MFYLKVESKGFPQKEHATIEAAEAEALRLSVKEGKRVAVLGAIKWIEPQRLFRITVTAGGRDFRSGEMSETEAVLLMREVLGRDSRAESRLPNEPWKPHAMPSPPDFPPSSYPYTWPDEPPEPPVTSGTWDDGSIPF